MAIMTQTQNAAWIKKKLPSSRSLHLCGEFDNADSIAIAITVENNLDSFNDDSPTFRKMIAYGRSVEKAINWQWIHKDFLP